MDIVDLLKIVQQASILTDCVEASFPALSKRGLVAGVLGKAAVEGREIEITIGISHDFPHTHPVFFLINGSDFHMLPHVEEDGFICYTGEDTLVLDVDNPSGIIQDSFEIAKQTLSNGIAKRNAEEFYNEYEAYWRRLTNGVNVFSNIALCDEVSVLKCTKVKDTLNFFAASDDTDRIGSYGRFFNVEEAGPQFFNGLYIPLLPGSKIFIPQNDFQLSILNIVDVINKRTSAENKKRLEKLLIKTKKDDLIVFSLPQPNGYYSLFGIRIKGINYRTHPLLNSTIDTTIIPFSLAVLIPSIC